MAVRRGSYRDYLTALKACDQARIILVAGPQEYLQADAVQRLRDRAVAQGAVVTSLEAASLNEANIVSLCSQASLFEPQVFYVLRRCESARNLAKVLKTLKGPPAANTLCLVTGSDAPSAPLKTELARLGMKSVPCLEPWPNEIGTVLQDLAAKSGLRLAPDALQILVEACGTDLVTLSGELNRIAMEQGPSHDKPPLRAADIAPSLGLLREDDRYALDQLLMKRQWPKAQALAFNLMTRGERALSLVGLIASHCRTVLRLSDGMQQGLPPAALASVLKMPPAIAKLYVQALASGSTRLDPKPYTKALLRCQEADMTLKSSPVSEELVVSELLATLAAT